MRRMYLVLLLVALASCSKSNNNSNSSNFVSCKVNGTTWEAKDGEFLTTSRSVRIEDSGRAFVLDATHRDNSSQIAVRAYDQNSIKSGTYQLEGPGIMGGMYNLNSVYYRTDSTNNKGVLNVTISEGRATGTFSFKAVNTFTSDTVEITDGKFSLPI